MANKEIKLVLFDIDGTLIRHVGEQKSVGFPRFRHVIDKVYGKEIDIEKVAKNNYGGWVDKGIVRHMLKGHNVSEEEFEEKWPMISVAMRQYAQTQVQDGRKLYQSFPDAVELAIKLRSNEHIRIGLLTGNVERMGWWKIEHAGILNVFGFGVFADDVDDRITLASTVFARAKKHFGIDFAPEQVVVIGDTVYDIRCGKSIGAKTIAVTTGMHSSLVKSMYAGKSARDPYKIYYQELAAEKPDFLVQSLMDPAICDYFGVSV